MIDQLDELSIVVAKLRFGDAAYKVRVIVLTEGAHIDDTTAHLRQHRTDFGNWESDTGTFRLNGKRLGQWVTTAMNEPNQIPPAPAIARANDVTLMVWGPVNDQQFLTIDLPD